MNTLNETYINVEEKWENSPYSEAECQRNDWKDPTREAVHMTQYRGVGWKGEKIE
jgi:hypothetical protein